MAGAAVIAVGQGEEAAKAKQHDKQGQTERRIKQKLKLMTILGIIVTAVVVAGIILHFLFKDKPEDEDFTNWSR